MRNLWRRLAARHAIFLSLSLFLLAGFEFLMCGIVSTTNISGALQELMKSIPPFMRVMITDFLGGLSDRGMLAFGWDHPIAQALGTAPAIVLGMRAISGEIEGGVMELVMSQPLSRRQYVVAQVAFAAFALAVLSIGGMAGTVVGERIFRIDVFDFGSLLKLGLNFFLLQIVWYGISLAFSVLGREAGRVASAAFLVVLLSYLVNVIAKLWGNAAFLLPYSLHTYYSPRAVLVDNTLAEKPVVVLCVAFAVCIGFVTWHFERRDIP
jgi:ABC-type transport system involved in multi-copper enzyme maturation permease subunit